MLDSISQVTRILLDPADLYAGGSQIVFTSGEGKLQREKIDYQVREGDIYHTVSFDELLTGIAYQRYKNKVSRPSRYWFVIADANGIQNPLDLTSLVGTEIVIPDIIAFLLIQ